MPGERVVSSVGVCKPGFAPVKPDRDADYQYEIIGIPDFLEPERISWGLRVAIDSTLDRGRGCGGLLAARGRAGLFEGNEPYSKCEPSRPTYV